VNRRRLVALVSGLSLLGLGFLATLAAVLVTRSDTGRDWVRELLMTRLKGSVHGRMYVGKISGSMLTGVVVDSLEIRDEEDSLFLATGRISVTYDPRDLWDRRILLNTVEVEHPVVHVRKYEEGGWNYKRIFRRGERRRTPRTGPGFGDYIIADSVALHDLTFVLTMPWHPADSLRGARRDSAVAFNLARTNAEIRRAGRHLTRTWRWTGGEARISHARIAQPDSVGKLFVVSDLAVRESDPPFLFSNVRATVRNLGDSVWVDAGHFDLPGSTGRASGKIVWGSGLPVRYDINVVGDSVSLRDVAWVYPTLPQEGGGSMRLRIRNDPRNLSVIDYALTRMDVRTTRSRLLGAMTYGVGGPVLVVKDVELEAAPVDFELLRTLNGKPFPVDWQGQVTGTVRGPGGPLNRFEVEEAQFAFRDAHVPGAVTRGSARGGLDILFPALTRFRGLDVDVERLDLRTVTNLFPNFPRIGGTIAGRATLDSSWLDVRFSEADVTHSTGAGAPSRATGGGRVTWGEEFMTYDVDVVAAPVTLDSFLAEYELPLRGQLAGPIRARGTVEDLDLSVALEGAGARLVFDGHVDAFPPGLRAHGVGRVEGLDLRAFVTDSRVPASALTARFSVDLGGDSLTNLDGRLAVDADRSTIARMLVYPSSARLRFGGGRIFVDSLGIETAAARLDAQGALGLHRGVSDSLRYWVLVDSLGGLRRFISRPTLAARPALDGPPAPMAAPDSLLGSIQVAGVARGSIDSLDSGGTLRGTRLYVNGHRAQVVRGEYAIEDVMGRARGTATVAADTAVVAGIRLTTAEGRLRLDAPDRGRVSVDVRSASGPTLLAGADVVRLGPGRQALTVDTLTVAVRDHAWRLMAPVRARVGVDGFAIDSLVVRDPDGGALALAGSVPTVGAVDLTMSAERVSLAELGDLLQAQSTLDGAATLRARVTGTRQSPVLEARASADGARVGEVRFQSLRARAAYSNRRLDAELDLYRDSSRVARATASLPVDLALVPGVRRLLDDTLRVRVNAERVDLSLLEATTPAVRSATGLLDVDVRVTGRWEEPRLSGSLGVVAGALDLVPLGIRLTDVNADVRVADDIVTVRRLAMRSVGEGVGEEAGAATLRGTIDLGRRSNPVFDLVGTLRRFEAMDLPRTARIELSTGSDGVRLTGPFRRAHVSGTLIVDRGEIRIPELVQKRVISLDDPDFYNIVDTTLTTNRQLVRAPSAFVDSLTLDNVRLRIGDNVWLRSAEANIQLGGEVEVSRSPASRREEPTITLFGELSADRGTYTLNIGEFVQRNFTVDRGRLLFSGGRDLNPELDISAVHTVRQTRTSDNIRVRATIRGTFARPTLELSSDEGYQISQSDLLSYLVTGAPSYELSSGSAQNLATSTVLRSAGAVVSGWSQQYTGGLIDIIDIQTAGVLEEGNRQQELAEAFRHSRIGVGKQILDGRAFLSANSGLCSIGGGGGSGADQVTFTDAIGLRLEARLPKGYSLEVSQEPASTALLCGRSSARGLAPTPKQVGFDLFRTWQF
jgi:translocation and assembly module TamB